MKKVAIYARYSSDLQTDRSIEDQLRICREHAERARWQVVDCYSDRALSGATMMRPGLQNLLLDAQSGKFDIVLSEGLDRISRDQEDVAHIYKRLRFAGLTLFTLSEGEVNELHIGIGGTINAMFLKQLGQKTRRGMEGRALAGKCAGGKTYGYDVVHRYEGGQLVRGERVINPDESAIVIRICTEYATTKSPRRIAIDLNKDGIPGPRGRAWSASSIYGNRHRGTGIINNELYVGIQIWNRQRFQKNPDTGKRVARMNDPKEWVRAEVPALRIVDQALWDQVKAVQASLEMTTFGMPKEKRPPRMFSYLIRCAECGGGCSMISATHYGCTTARNKGTCSNRLGYDAVKLEHRVLVALQSRLMDPELCSLFCREYTDHLNRIRISANVERAQHEAELERVERGLRKLVDAIKDGCDAKLIKDDINGLERRKLELTDLLDASPASPVLIHPNMAHRYHAEVQRLIDALQDAEHREKSIQVARNLITGIVLTPNENRSELVVDLLGDLAGILTIANGHPAIAMKAISKLNRIEQDEVHQVQAVIGGSRGATVPEVFTSRQVKQGALVAGAGFEPATFRL